MYDYVASFSHENRKQLEQKKHTNEASFKNIH